MEGVASLERPLPEKKIEGCTEILKVLANTGRLKLINILVTGEYTVSELCDKSGLKQSLVSQQLKSLRLNNIVERRRKTPHVYYSLKEKGVINLLRCLNGCGPKN